MDVDDTAARFYRGLSGPLGDRLRAVLRTDEDGTIMINEDNRCPMWRQDGLCRIQAELGHDALCKTCREFPRLLHEFGSFTELDLELSCPEAARLIFSTEYQDICHTLSPDPEEPVEDADILDILLQSRETALSILDHYPLGQALAVLLLYAGAIQSQIDGGEAPLPSLDNCLGTAQEFARSGDIKAIAEFFKNLEILTPGWKARLDNTAASPCPDQQLLPLARYGIRRYWLQALSDLDLFCRVKFILIACILVSALGGDPVQTSQQFSKEIENDPDNLNAILDACYTNPAFADIALLDLLLNAEKA